MAQRGKVISEAANGHRPWVILQSFAGWRPRDLGADTVAGLTLAAIAIPEQMATARLAKAAAADRLLRAYRRRDRVCPLWCEPQAFGRRGFDHCADFRRGARGACRGGAG
jgi:hypothetical protein